MTAPAFFFDCPALPAQGETVLVDGAEGRHAVTVKRLTPGEQVLLITEHQARLVGEVVATQGKDQLHVRIDEVEHLTPATPQVTIIQALPKSDRSELSVDLNTQGGVDVIVPWQAQRCVSRWEGNKAAKGVAKWRAAAIAAAKQSRRSSVPQVTDLVVGMDAVDVAKQADLILIFHEQAATPLSSINFDGVGSVAIIIGPEGGLSDEEVEAFRAAGGQAVLMGPEVLRAACAGLAALAAIGALVRW